jgi:Uma2 family endonuclease
MAKKASHEPDPYGRALTHQDLAHTPDDGNIYEIIDGELYVTPFPSVSHQQVVTQLTGVLNQHVRREGLGRVFTAGLKVVLDEPTGVGPDIVFISQARMDGLRPDGYYGVPELVVEVLSSKPALDQHVKKHKYARAGIPHYWIVDPDLRRLLAYRLEGRAYRLLAEHEAQDVFRPELFPGLDIELAQLWLD